MPSPAISLVIPVHDGERFIAAAVESARAQEPAPDEIIVVDDGSTDGTRELVLAMPGVRCARQAKRGPGAARNHGVRLASGAFLAFLDADDRWTRGKTALQLALLRDHPDVDVVVGHCQRVVITAWDGATPAYAEVGEPVFYLHLGSALFRREAFDRVGPFEERHPMGEDVDWYLRAKELGLRMRFHREVVQYRLLHDRNLTLRRDEADRGLVRVFRRSLERRRARGPGSALAGWSEETQWLSAGPR